MAAQLYPLVFKPGIKRDGTTFQGEYCTDGQWVRWQRGVVRKIGGMRALNRLFDASADQVNRNNFNIFLLPNTVTNNVIFYLLDGRKITMYVMSNDMVLQADIPKESPAIDKDNILWQVQPIINVTYNAQGVAANGASLILFLGTANLTNINNAIVGTLYKQLTTSGNITASVDADVKPLDGGMCYSSPCLFFYGSNGEVKYSRRVGNVNTQLLTATNYTSITISNDKVIYGTPIRGGAASPCLLFWTVSSVVRIVNATAADATAINFRIDTISQSSSIISSRAVVEYDNIFYWIGTDRFFIYNGVVSELANPMNLNYFFNNVDMSRRQQIFGVKNAKYGEIWWFYPVIGIPGSNSRAIIYNIRENSWYDTAISRDAGMFLESNGNMYTFGQQLVNPAVTNRFLFAHEIGTNEEISYAANIQRIEGGTASSNTGVTNDNLGGGNPQYAFLQPPNPEYAYTQNRNTNLMYDYGANNLQTITQIQVIRNNVSAAATYNYRYLVVVEKSNDLITWTEIARTTKVIPPNIFNPTPVVVDIVNPQPARAFRLLSDNNILLNSSNITAFVLNGIAPLRVSNLGIPSYFTTPVFAWSSFNPLKQVTGTDRWVYLQRLEPDFIMGLPATAAAKAQTINMIIKIKKYAQDDFTPVVLTNGNNGESLYVREFDGATGKIDLMVQGRQISFEFSSTNFFEMGHCFMLLGIGDAQ